MIRHLLLAGFVLANMLMYSDKVAAEQASMPIDITSEQMEVFRALNKATFTGNVKIVYGKATMGSKSLDVHYANNEDNIEKVVAQKDVIIVHGDNTATGDKAVYTPEIGAIKLTGNVVMTKGENILTGENLVYDLETGDMRLNNNAADGRVKAKFTIKGNN